ncbi:hypothetical protein [Mycobacterium hubeiense]|uniref:hypothetical protein n=1 Tax=Mycobacterium hubeiense TaxID=1867256 RepID=UPI0018EBED09|nr:hypothetical protein [Mycobacterium sp. QGD 101]
MTCGSAIRWGVVAAILAAVAGCGVRAEPVEYGAAPVFSVGDCVEIPSTTPDMVRARKVACSADPSYTVGAITDASGNCPSAEYQRLPTQFAEPTTARLCLVPNLVADHCYELDMPIGIVELADCADRGRGVLVQVTQRLDVRDQSACPTQTGHFAWPYPSPARTYCTRTVY